MTQAPSTIRPAATLITFAAALTINSAATIAWYWWRPLLAGLAPYLPHLTTVFGGFLVGVLAGSGTPMKLALLAALIAVNDGIIHWVAAQVGLTGDMTTVTAITFMSSLEMLFNLPLVLIGGALGWASRRRRQRDVK